MADGGVFAVARAVWDSPDFGDEPFSRREAWIWLIGAAAWRDCRVRGTKKTVTIHRSEFCFSVRFLAEKWKWSKSRVDRMLSALENRDTIRDTSRDGEKIYSIINYNDFQFAGDQQRDSEQDSKRDTSGTRAGHERDKEEEGNKGIKEDSSLRSESIAPPKRKGSKTTLPEGFPANGCFEAATAHWAKHGRDDLSPAEEAAKFRAHHLAHGSRMADWGQAWVTWYCNAVRFSRPGNGSVTAGPLFAPVPKRKIYTLADIDAAQAEEERKRRESH